MNPNKRNNPKVRGSWILSDKSLVSVASESEATMAKAYRRLYQQQLEKFDRINDTSYIREVEMIVDSIVTFEPRYSMQFFADFRLYGIDEAKTYLIKFVAKNYQSPDDLAQDISKLSLLIDKIHNAYGTGLVASAIKN